MHKSLNTQGTTSAYAENTARDTAFQEGNRNYLRVRGEYDLSTIERISPAELPPRTRRIPHPAADPAAAPGTTSAYAENTGKLFT